MSVYTRGLDPFAYRAFPLISTEKSALFILKWVVDAGIFPYRRIGAFPLRAYYGPRERHSLRLWRPRKIKWDIWTVLVCIGGTFGV